MAANQNLSQNWRSKRAPPKAQGAWTRGKALSGASSAAGSTQSLVPGKNIGGLRDSDKLHAPAAYKPGCIFSAPFHAQDVEIGHKEKEFINTRTESAHGPIHSKFRKLVVVKSFFKHCVAVPMYTFSNTGLTNKSDYLPEYISIRDPNQLNSNSITPDTLHGILWTDGTNRKSPDDKRFYATNPNSVLHLTQLVSHDYMMKSTLHGKLMPESTGRLVGLFEEVARRDRVFDVIGEGGNGVGRKWLGGGNGGDGEGDWPGRGLGDLGGFGAPSI